MVSSLFVVGNASGFHARPAGLFVETAGRFRARIRVLSGGREADGKSILSLMLLGVTAGTQIAVEAEGDDETEALAALAELIRGGFGEPPAK
jgi:phosphocarrier protein HPr